MSGQKVEHRIDVTDRIDGPGVYAVTFTYTQGMEALEMQRAALVVKSTDRAEKKWRWTPTRAAPGPGT